MENTRPSKAFTLLEMLVCMLGISVLTAITLPLLSGVRNSARDTMCRTNLRTLGQALSSYRNDHPPRYLIPNVAPMYHLTSGNTSMLDVIGDELSVRLPYINQSSGEVVTSQPFLCPSDRLPAPQGTALTNGCSYLYWPGFFMVPHPQPGMMNPVIATSLYEHTLNGGIYAEADSFHAYKLGLPGFVGKNGVRLDGSAVKIKKEEDFVIPLHN